MFDRRQCLQSMAALSALGLGKAFAENSSSTASSRIWIFTKPIQELSFKEAADWLVRWDVGGFEATTRKGGWIEPNEAASKLPQLMEAMTAVKRTGMIVTTDINDANQPDVDQVLRVASQLGIRYFRMAYYKYDLTKKIIPQLESFAIQASKLAAVCKQLNMTALYQNHAGAANVGAPLWDLMEVMRGIDPSLMSIAIDLRHTTIEGTEAWRANYARVRDSIGAVFVKDAIHANGEIDDGPLGRSEKGKQLFRLVQADHPAIPISLHMEYFDHRKAELLPQRLEAIGQDIATLKLWLK